MKNILVLTDFSDRAEHAAEVALLIAHKAHAKISLRHNFYVPEHIPAQIGVFPYYEDIDAIREEHYKKLELLAKNLKRNFEKESNLIAPEIDFEVEHGDLATGVKDLLDFENFWLIVMGDKSRDKGISRFVFGSNCHDIIEIANCPVLLVPDRIQLKEVDKILFASELLKSEQKALNFLKKFSGLWHSQIVVMHVVPENFTENEMKNHLEIYKKTISGIDYPDIVYIDMLGKDVSETIASYTKEEKVDILAIIHKKRSALERLFHKSISKQMMNYHEAPILVLPQELL